MNHIEVRIRSLAMESISEQFLSSEQKKCSQKNFCHEQKMELENVRSLENVRLSTSCTRKENFVLIANF